MVDLARETDHEDGVWGKFSRRVFSFVVDCVTLSSFPLVQGQRPVNSKATQAAVSQVFDEIFAR